MKLTDEQLVEALTEADHDDIAEALTAKLDEAGGDQPKTPAKAPAKAPAASFGERLQATAKR